MPRLGTMEFWSVIETVKGSRQALIPILQKMAQPELYEFYREYEAARAALDGAGGVAEWAIAQGPRVYRDLCEHPEKRPLDPPDERGVGFGGLANRTFRERFGQDLYELFYGP